MPEATVDHLAFIRIRGLQSAETEVFQGAAGGGGPVDGGTVTTQSDWTAIPEEVIAAISTYTDDLNSWLEGMNAEARSRGVKSREVTALAPYVPNIISTAAAGGAIVATGGAAVPAVATMLVTQTISNLIGQAVQNYISANDENGLAYIMKKALLYDNQNGDEKASVLNDRLSDLAYVDETVDLGFCRVHIKGKMIAY